MKPMTMREYGDHVLSTPWPGMTRKRLSDVSKGETPSGTPYRYVVSEWTAGGDGDDHEA